MRIFRVLIFLLCSCLSFADSQSLDKIRTLVVRIEEISNVNNKKKTSEYDLKFVKPDKVRKDVILPEFNRGEIYIYKGNEKTVYLPFFEQITKEKIDSDENDIIQAINYILNIEKKDPEFSKNYYSGKLKDIKLENGTEIGIEKLKDTEGYLLPYRFKIYDGKTEVAVLNIRDYKVNTEIADKEFNLDD